MAEKRFVVEAGDCLLSIGAQEGIPWKKIWEYGANEDLRRDRESPTILLPGDVVIVPEREAKECDIATDNKHRFQRKGSKVEIRIRVIDVDGPRENEPYHVEIDGQRYEGKTEWTDNEGLAICEVPATCKHAILVVGDSEDEYELLVGYMDPANTVTGLHARLENLGYFTGGVHTNWDGDSANAMQEFLRQSEKDGIENAGNPQDSKNRDALVKTYSV